MTLVRWPKVVVLARINRWRDMAGALGDTVQALSVTDKQKTSRGEIIKQPFDRSPTRLGVEIDQYVAAKYRVKPAAYKIGVVVQIESLETNEGDDFRSGLHFAGLRPDAAQHETLEILLGNFIRLGDRPCGVLRCMEGPRR